MRLPGQSKIERGTPYEVIESDGVQGERYPVEYVKAFNEGYLFLYKRGVFTERVYAGRKYRPLRVGQVWWIGKNRGNNSAALLLDDTEILRPPDLRPELPWFATTELIKENGHYLARVENAVAVVGCSTDPDCPGEDLSRLVSADMVGIASKATRKASMTWLFIGIGVVVVIAILAYIMRG